MTAVKAALLVNVVLGVVFGLLTLGGAREKLEGMPEDNLGKAQWNASWAMTFLAVACGLMTALACLWSRFAATPMLIAMALVLSCLSFIWFVPDEEHGSGPVEVEYEWCAVPRPALLWLRLFAQPRGCTDRQGARQKARPRCARDCELGEQGLSTRAAAGAHGRKAVGARAGGRYNVMMALAVLSYALAFCPAVRLAMAVTAPAAAPVYNSAAPASIKVARGDEAIAMQPAC